MAIRMHLPAFIEREWVECAQNHAAHAIFLHSEKSKLDVAMQGGSALRLFYGAPRFSMDLDFVVNEYQLQTLSDTVPVAITDMARDLEKDLGPGVHVRLQGGAKSGKKLVRYKISIEQPDRYIGAAHLMVEFWPVSPDYLKTYAMKRGRMEDGTTINSADELLISTPNLKSIYIDKVLALCGRTHIKWRDIYDMWWISSKLRNWLPAPENENEMTTMFLNQASAYDLRDSDLALRGLRRFLDTDTPTIIKQATSELEKILDSKAYNIAFLVGDGAAQVVERAKAACQIVHDSIERRMHEHTYGTTMQAPAPSPTLSSTRLPGLG